MIVVTVIVILLVRLRLYQINFNLSFRVIINVDRKESLLEYETTGEIKLNNYGFLSSKGCYSFRRFVCNRESIRLLALLERKHFCEYLA